MDHLCSAYIGALMSYIELEYDNIPSEVTDEMESYFMECFREGRPVCLPDAAGVFAERFLKEGEK